MTPKPCWQAGAVTVTGDVTTVRSDPTTYVVRRTADGERCTCAWYAKHGLTRGPCKHMRAT